MASSSCFLFWLLLCVAAIHLSIQEGCAPGYVVDLTLRGNNTLTWDKSADEQCDLAYYLVHIAAIDGTIYFSYTVLNPVVHIHHLERCQGYTFRVFQISTDNITGPGLAIYSTTPPGADANLALNHVRLVQEGHAVRVSWSLDEEYIRCARNYRVVVYNEDDDVVYDLYTSLTNAIVHRVVPCGHYLFAVRAIFTLDDEGPITTLKHTAADFAAAAPVLAAVTMNSTAATFTWHLEEYYANRCPISNLIIDGSPYFNVTYPIRDQANRTPLSLRLTGLTPDTLYYLRVVANNTVGPSEPNLIAVQTLPS